MAPEPKPHATSTTGQPSWMAPVTPVVPDHELVRRIGGGSYGDVWLARTTVGTWRAVKVVLRDRFNDARPYEREFNGIQKFEPLSRGNEAFIDILQIGRNDAEGYFYYVMELADDANAELGGTNSASPQSNPSVGGTSSTNPQFPSPESESGPRVTRPCETVAAAQPDTYVPQTLAKVLLQRGRLPVSECLELGLTLNLGLAHLHKAGLIHRDIKPSNIIFVGGVPKLADIGLVIETVEARSFVGTEGFIPPEGPNSPQADLYSLGKVLYEAGMGKDRKEFPEPYTQIAEAPDATELLEFNTILLKACAAKREERYQTAEEMNADLALLQSGGSVRRQRKLAGQLRFVQRAGALVTALAAVIALGWWWQARQTKMVRELVEEKEHERKLAQENLYLADIRVAYDDWESGQIAKTLELLQQHIPQAAEPDRRGWEWYYLLSLCHREERTLKADPGGVQAVSCDPGGQRFASAGHDHTVRVWDAESGACLAELKGHTDIVYCVAWSPDGTRLASGGYDGTVILWDAERFQKLFVRNGYSFVWSVAWSPDGRRVAVGGAGHLPEDDDGLITIWDANSGQRLHYLKSNGVGIWSLAWHPGGKMLAAGGDWGQIQIWDTDNGQLLRTIQAHHNYVSSLAWRSDGRQLASASPDQRIRIWDAETWEPVTTIDPAHRGMVGTLVWSRDGERLISGGRGGSIKIWDARTGALLNTLRGHQGRVTSVAWWPGPGRILSGSADGTVKIWNPESVQVARTVADEGECTWSPDGRMLAVVSSQGNTNGGVIQILDVATWQPRFTLSGLTNRVPGNLAWSPDGRLLAACSEEEVQVWELATGKETLFVPEAHEVEGGVHTVAWSPDGRFLAAAGEDGAVRLWNVETKKNVLTFLGHSRAVLSAVWSPDGRWIASKDRNPGVVLIWEAKTGKVKLKLQCPGVFNPGSQYVVSWSPQGDKLAAGSGDGTVMVWETSSGRVLQVLKGHTSNVRSVHWSPDGRRLVSGAEDATIRIWDPQSGRELLVLPDLINKYPSVAWSPSGRMICVSGQSALIYDATLGYELAPQLTQSTTNR